MTTKAKKTASTANGNRPSHTVYHVLDQGDDRKANWMPIGAAWAHKDGKGFNLQLDTLPVPFDGRLTIRERKTKEEEGQ